MSRRRCERRGGCEFRRRDVVALLGSAAVGLPDVARAQQIACHWTASSTAAAAGPFARMIAGRLRRSLRSMPATSSGRNVRIIDVRWADGRYERPPQIWSPRMRSTCSRLRARTCTRVAANVSGAPVDDPNRLHGGADPVRLRIMPVQRLGQLVARQSRRASTSLPIRATPRPSPTSSPAACRWARSPGARRWARSRAAPRARLP